jgi:hypothetical protein
MTNSTDFYFGVLVGFLAAGVVGFLLQQFRFLYKRVKEANEPQKIVHTTEKSPRQVVTSSVRAGCILFLLTIGVIALCMVSIMIVE